ncbi:MAG: hypothetical protein ACU84Q_14685 [Gammaproteobacteria bacterium]
MPVYLAVFLPLLAFAYVHLEMHILYGRIAIGTHHTEITGKFGEPDRIEGSMLFCEDIFEWTGDCPDTNLARYDFYRTGIDRWVVIGFDDSGKAAFKSKGSL